ncbi:mediator of RNA polymerase ii transcription subunit 11 [Anaeramoeba ignava]|uniref:Mediator of RNA polymerase ii transcription subunit 11 n=1 Tax=Anaeramoeba ignava TaxID=1746090 RepID=A0A9Q0LVD3_ANAIG|nr:mediator of RNA polymerase ii transcription subunit 11 [Anaeramoeba ignava]
MQTNIETLQQIELQIINSLQYASESLTELSQENPNETKIQGSNYQYLRTINEIQEDLTSVISNTNPQILKPDKNILKNSYQNYQTFFLSAIKTSLINQKISQLISKIQSKEELQKSLENQMENEIQIEKSKEKKSKEKEKKKSKDKKRKKQK